MCSIRYFTFKYGAKNAMLVSGHTRVKEKDQTNTKSLWIVEYQTEISRQSNAQQVATSPISGSIQSTINPLQCTLVDASTKKA